MTAPAPPPSDVWDQAAADYEALAEPFTGQFAGPLLDLAQVGEGTRLLDVAAGTGAVALMAARRGARVLGTDFAPGMVARLAARLAEGGFADSDARVMDGQALDVADGAFDVALSAFGVMLFPDWARGLRELARAVRPGGRGGIAAWASAHGAGPVIAFVTAHRHAFPGADIPPFFPGMTRLSDPAGLRAAMAEAGFGNVALETVTGVWRGPPAAMFVAQAEKLFRPIAFYTALDADARARVLDAMPAALAPFADADGVAIPSPAHVAVGTR